MTETKNARRGRMGRGDRIALCLLIALVVFTLVISGLNALNLRLVAGELYLILPMLTLLLLIGWGLSALWRRLKPGAVRKVVGAVMVLGMALLLMLALTFASVFSGMNIPSRYAVLSDDAGHTLVVMRGLDPDEDRMNLRHEARLAADPEGNPEMTAEDWGFTYTAYAPAAMGFFYKPDSLLDGEVHIGYGSKAELMLEWSDGVGHFYIKNPEVGDDGEMHAQG